jgi:hypothetical protein
MVAPELLTIGAFFRKNLDEFDGTDSFVLSINENTDVVVSFIFIDLSS